MTMHKLLKPCPFCKGQAALNNDGGRWKQVICGSCGARGCEYPDDEDKAIAFWNRRALAAPGEPVAWLRDLQPDAEDEALAVCNRIDPGAFPVFASPHALNVEQIEQAIREYCRTLSAGAVQMSHGEERIYFAGIPVTGLAAVISNIGK